MTLQSLHMCVKHSHLAGTVHISKLKQCGQTTRPQRSTNKWQHIIICSDQLQQIAQLVPVLQSLRIASDPQQHHVWLACVAMCDYLCMQKQAAKSSQQWHHQWFLRAAWVAVRQQAGKGLQVRPGLTLPQSAATLSSHVHGLH